MALMPPVLAFLGTLGTPEILFILLIIMLLFGAAKIPELARSMGKAQREFHNAKNQVDKEVNTPPSLPTPPPPQEPAPAPQPAPTSAQEDQATPEETKESSPGDAKQPEEPADKDTGSNQGA